MSFQRTFADAEWQGRQRKTRRAAFLEQMDSVTPWADLVALVEPHRPYPVSPTGTNSSKTGLGRRLFSSSGTKGSPTVRSPRSPR